MKHILVSLLALAVSAGVSAQTYTNQYEKPLVRLAAKWVKKGEWRNGFTKASPSDRVNLADFYIQYQRDPAQWQALFRWLQETDLLALTAGRHPIPGTQLTASVEDGDNWASEQDLRDGKGSESHRQKIDFMYVVKGFEGFARLDHETSTPLAPYKPDRLEYHFQADRLERFENTPGTFQIMFPQDWHIAKVRTSHESQTLRVIVVKMDYAQ